MIFNSRNKPGVSTVDSGTGVSPGDTTLRPTNKYELVTYSPDVLEDLDRITMTHQLQGKELLKELMTHQRHCAFGEIGITVSLDAAGLVMTPSIIVTVFDPVLGMNMVFVSGLRTSM